MKKQLLLGLVLGALLIAVIGANIDSRSMNPNQFNTAGNKLSIKDGVTLTNIHIHEILDRNGNFSMRNITNGAAGNGELDLYDGTAAGYKTVARGGNDILSLGGGWGTTLLINSIHPTDRAASKLLRTDASTNLAEVTVGTGVSFDGTTLTGSTQDVVRAMGDATVTNNLTVLGSSAGAIGTLTLKATNAVGSMSWQPAGNLPAPITNIFNGTNFTAGWQWFVSSSNANVITWTSGPPVTVAFVIQGGLAGLNNNTRYCNVTGSQNNGAEITSRTPWPQVQTFSQFYFNTGGSAVGGGTNITITVLTNGVATALVTTLTGNGSIVAATNLVNTATVPVAGVGITIQVTTVGNVQQEMNWGFIAQ